MLRRLKQLVRRGHAKLNRHWRRLHRFAGIGHTSHPFCHHPELVRELGDALCLHIHEIRLEGDHAVGLAALKEPRVESEGVVWSGNLKAATASAWQEGPVAAVRLVVDRVVTKVRR